MSIACKKMRLIDSRTIKLEEFSGDPDVPYAILSHRWEEGEVLFQHLHLPRTDDQRVGWLKIQNACEQALRNGLDYIWIDTLCINKDSSAELSEAINSMYRWYSQAVECYAYLSDVSETTEENVIFEDSAWFTRGWTLQELIAPSVVKIFNQNWALLGTKETLKGRLSAITGIDAEVFAGKDPANYSIAQRMSWASRRVTTRIEDVAYSLMGLFDVYMPMLYGEGENAFLRLQREIIQLSNDQSIFAWTRTEEGELPLLARSPAAFANCHGIVSNTIWDPTPYTINNLGLEITLPMIPWTLNTYLAFLACEDLYSPSHVAIFLEKQFPQKHFSRKMLDGKDSCYIALNRLQQMQKSLEMKIVPVRVLLKSLKPTSSSLYGFKLGTCDLFAGLTNSTAQASPVWVYSRKRIVSKEVIEIPEGQTGLAGLIAFSTISTSSTFKSAIVKPNFILKLGFDWDFNPICKLDNSNEEKLRLQPPEVLARDEHAYNDFLSWSWNKPVDDWRHKYQNEEPIVRGNKFTWKFLVANPARILSRSAVVERLVVEIIRSHTSEVRIWLVTGDVQ